jgi:hypothetical protein
MMRKKLGTKIAQITLGREMKKGQICTKAVHECLQCNGCKWLIKLSFHRLKLVPAHRNTEVPACGRQAFRHAIVPVR